MNAAPHRHVPVVLLAVLMLGALTLLTIVARSPYTHANLGMGDGPGYARTPQALIGDEELLPGADAGDPVADTAARGAILYVRAGCAGCHAPGGSGGVVGPRIAGTEADTVAQRVRQGPAGMPRFSTSGLTDDEVTDIAAYLRSLATR